MLNINRKKWVENTFAICESCIFFLRCYNKSFKFNRVQAHGELMKCKLCTEFWRRWKCQKCCTFYCTEIPSNLKRSNFNVLCVAEEKWSKKEEEDVAVRTMSDRKRVVVGCCFFSVCSLDYCIKCAWLKLYKNEAQNRSDARECSMIESMMSPF